MYNRPESYKIRHLTEETSKQSIEGETSFLLTYYNEVKKVRDELKKTMWSKKEPEREDLAISQPMHIYTKKKKRKKACSEENTKDVAKQSLDKETCGWWI